MPCFTYASQPLKPSSYLFYQCAGLSCGLCVTYSTSRAVTGLSGKLQGNAADTILSGSAGSAASQRLAAWRPHSIHEPPTDRPAGSIADSSSGSSSSISHEGDSASSVTSSDHLRISRLSSHTSTGPAVQPNLHKSTDKETLDASAAAGTSDSL